MSKLNDKIVFITGASSGMGKACAEQFAAVGAKLILTARRLDKIEALTAELKKQYGTLSLTLALDVQNKKQVLQLIEALPSEWQAIDIVVNNAGLALDSVKFQDGNLDNWDTMIDTNLRGLLYVTRAIVPGMIQRKQGHIINIGSVAAHDYYPTGNIYSATKTAVRAISKSLRIDLLGTGIRVTEIDPGLTHTEFSEVRWQDKQKADAFYEGYTPLVANDIAEAVLFCANRPPHVDIAELVIYPTAQASNNHIHKQGNIATKLFD